MSRKTAPAYPIPNLRKWRDSRFFSQAQLAKNAGVSVATIKYLESPTAENRHPASAATVSKLAKALGITEKQLVQSAPEDSEAPAVATSGRGAGVEISQSAPA